MNGTPQRRSGSGWVWLAAVQPWRVAISRRNPTAIRPADVTGIRSPRYACMRGAIARHGVIGVARQDRACPGLAHPWQSAFQTVRRAGMSGGAQHNRRLRVENEGCAPQLPRHLGGAALRQVSA